jgi:leukotriene-A4 hydrolase
MMLTIQVKVKVYSFFKCSILTRFLAQYYKGAAVLWFLEHDIVRSEADFDQFLRSYIVQFSHRILNTDDFIQYFESYFPYATKVDWNSWLYTPGMPPITIDFSTELERKCRQLADQPSLISNEQMKLLNANQIAYLLNLLLNQQPSTVTYDLIKQIDENCQMNHYSNGDICYQWYQLCIRVKYIESLEDIFKFLRENGEMKFLKPMYTEFKSSWPELMPRVLEFFEEHKKCIHPLLVKQIQQRIGV